MAFQLILAFIVTTILIAISFTNTRRLRNLRALQAAQKLEPLDPTGSLPKPTVLSKTLASVLPDSVIFPHDAIAFKQSMDSYWYGLSELKSLLNLTLSP